MLEFRNAEIYKLYFKKIASEHKEIDLNRIVNNIARYMFAEFQFDKMPIEELHLSSDDLDSLRNLLDNNLIISRSVHAGTGITERKEEYVYFVFDELRDFCLARYLLTFPCSFGIGDDTFSVNLKQHSLQEAWESESFAKFREKQTKVCANCTTGICRSCGLELGLNLCGNIKGNLQ